MSVLADSEPSEWLSKKNIRGALINERDRARMVLLNSLECDPSKSPHTDDITSSRSEPPISPSQQRP